MSSLDTGEILLGSFLCTVWFVKGNGLKNVYNILILHPVHLSSLYLLSFFPNLKLAVCCAFSFSTFSFLTSLTSSFPQFSFVCLFLSIFFLSLSLFTRVLRDSISHFPVGQSLGPSVTKSFKRCFKHF